MQALASMLQCVVEWRCGARRRQGGRLAAAAFRPVLLDFGAFLSDWVILCDFDGTIATDDVTDSLLLRFGLPGWQDLEVDWRAGRIGSRACMSGQVALLDCSVEELDEHLDGIDIDPQFGVFAAAVERAGWPLTVVSDGLDYAISRILVRHELGHLPIIANRLEPTGPRSWRLDFPHARGGCASGTCKCARVASPGSRTLLIGDGASDFCVAAKADLSWARERLLDHCRRHLLPHRAVADFAQALTLWPGLVLAAQKEDLHV
jgi:2-hydroxy-3-keto-5-methylthiopentenyl-1-phosphate phosphatase